MEHHFACEINRKMFFFRNLAILALA